MNDDEFKKITRQTFDDVADEYIKRDQAIINETTDVRDALENFSKILFRNAKILDIGSGGGRDSRILFAKGFSVVGIDFSSEMIRQSEQIEPRIQYRVMDFEKMDFPDNTFNGVWTNASLHHIPKVNLPLVLENIKRILSPGGILFIKVKQGKYDDLRYNDKFGKRILRYFAYYEPSELIGMVNTVGLEVTKVQSTPHGEWVDLFAKKLNQ